jgi:tRNA 5-methylaminomethyl-2-thiouridine biosynthesis bifunctional protein
LAEHHSLSIKTNTQIVKLEQSPNGWTLVTANNDSWVFDQVIVASAFDAKQISQTEHLPLNPIAGQITQLTAQERHQQLKAVICTDRYVMPTQNDSLTIGSTFRVKSTNTDVTQPDHEENIKNLNLRVPGLLNETETVKAGRSAVRCTSPDYLPLIGPICEPEQLKEQFRIPLQRNRAHKEPAAKILPGLWTNVAHGSKGLCSSHISARLLASMIAAEPLPLQTSIVSALNPNRFVIRGLLREKRQKL